MELSSVNQEKIYINIINILGITMIIYPQFYTSIFNLIYSFGIYLIFKPYIIGFILYIIFIYKILD